MSGGFGTGGFSENVIALPGVTQAVCQFRVVLRDLSPHVQREFTRNRDISGEPSR